MEKSTTDQIRSVLQGWDMTIPVWITLQLLESIDELRYAIRQIESSLGICSNEELRPIEIDPSDEANPRTIFSDQ